MFIKTDTRIDICDGITGGETEPIDAAVDM
jgi:hypothetical protein